MVRYKNKLAILALLLASGCANVNILGENTGPSGSLEGGDQARSRGDLAAAVRNYRDAIKQDSDNKQAYLNLGYTLLDSNNANEAYSTFKDAQSKFGKCGDVYRGMGSALLVMGRPEDAMVQYSKALSINPQDPKAINGQGVVWELLGDTQRAQVAYRAAMELDPSRVEYESNYALSLAVNGSPQEAVHILERLSSGPNASPRVRQNLALAYGLAGNFAQAKRVARKDLDDASVRNNLSYIRTMSGIDSHSSRMNNVIPTSLQNMPMEAGRKDKE